MKCKGVISALLAIFLISAPAMAGEFDGTWKGRWGGGSSAQIVVAKDKVTSYRFNGNPQRVGGTSVNGKKLVVGSDFKITMTLTGKNAADAAYSGPHGKAAAKLTRN
jgi:hypothetical protein